MESTQLDMAMLGILGSLGGLDLIKYLPSLEESGTLSLVVDDLVLLIRAAQPQFQRGMRRAKHPVEPTKAALLSHGPPKFVEVSSGR